MQQGTVDLSQIKSWCWTKPTACWTWASSATSARCWPRCRPSARTCCSRPPSPTRSRLADGLLNNPALIEVARRNSTEVIAQIHPVDRDKKHPMLAHLIKTHQWKQVLVFTRTKHGANKLVEQLARDGITAMAIHGNKSQSARTKALAEFKDGKLTALVATDIAARGIDIDQLPHVVNYDLPNVPEDYVHRIGRTGRAGATGEAVSLVCVDEHDLLHDIERFIKREIPVEVIAGFEPDPTAAATDPAAQRPGPSPERWRTRRPTQAPRKPAGNGNATAPKPAGGNAGHGQAAKPPAAAAQWQR
jgi:ATP-dependent RNA helicase RhlE